VKAGKLLRAWWTGRNGDTPGEPGNACRPPCISPAKRQRERDNVDHFVIDNNSPGSYWFPLAVRGVAA